MREEQEDIAVVVRAAMGVRRDVGEVWCACRECGARV